MFFLLILELLLCGALSEFTPPAYPVKIVSSQCGHHNHFDEQLTNVLGQIKQQLLVQNAPCKCILHNYPSAPSGYYNITTANGSSVQVYCDMEGTNCGGEGGWTRVAYVNMTQPGATCPQGLEQQSLNGSSYCGRFSPGEGCVSAAINTNFRYQQVCGRVAGYQNDGPDGFAPFYRRNAIIDQIFFDGLSIMYGTPRRNIWTYSAGFSESTSYDADCPCNNGFSLEPLPYIGNNYYCESGNSAYDCKIFHNSDTLWDGQQCGGVEAPCCTHPNMPWFIKTLSETTTEDIELRACTTNEKCNGTVPIFLIELYIQ